MNSTIVFEQAEELAALLRSTAHQKFLRGGMIVPIDALGFYSTSARHTAEQRSAAKQRVQTLLRNAEEHISAHGSIVLGELSITLSQVVGLHGLHLMLAKKFARELLQ